MFSNERTQLRGMMFEAWEKAMQKKPLEPLEQQIVNAILLHPEYESLFSKAEQFENKDFGNHNPFLHIALHLSIQDQIQSNRPSGITPIYHQLIMHLKDSHLVQHKMMACLEYFLWNAQQTGVMLDEAVYLEKIKQLLD